MDHQNTLDGTGNGVLVTEARFWLQRLDLAGMYPARVALALGVEPSTVYHWRDGSKKPSPLAVQALRMLATIQSIAPGLLSVLRLSDTGEFAAELDGLELRAVRRVEREREGKFKTLQSHGVSALKGAAWTRESAAVQS